MARRPPVLSASASRALPYIESGARAGLSSRAIGQTLTAAGLGVRRTELLRALAYVKDTAQAGERLRFVRKDRSPDPARLPVALHPRTMLREYAYVAEVRGFDPVTGDSATSYVTVSTSRRLTVGEIEDTAAALVADPEAYLPTEVAEVVVTTAKRRG